MASDQVRTEVEDLIKLLVNATHERGLYGEEHKLVREAVDNLYMVLNKIFSEREEITIGVIGNEIAFDQKPFYHLSKKIKGFIEYLKKTKFEKITFFKGLQKREGEAVW